MAKAACGRGDGYVMPPCQIQHMVLAKDATVGTAQAFLVQCIDNFGDGVVLG